MARVRRSDLSVASGPGGLDRPALASDGDETTNGLYDGDECDRGQALTEPTWRQELTDKAIRNELDGRHPERKELRPTGVSGLRRVLRIPNGYHPWGVPPEGADPPEGEERTSK